MMNTNRMAFATLLGLATLLSLTPAQVSGQSAESVPVFIAIPDHFPDLEARAVLMREPGRDIVLLDANDETPVESLRTALLLLRRVRRDQPLISGGRGQLVPLTGYVTRREIDPAVQERLEAMLSELDARPIVQVGNLGPGRWMPYRAR